MSGDLVKRLQGIAALPNPDNHADLTHEVAVGTLTLLKLIIGEAADRIATLEDQLATVRAETEWQPIETAPRDGTSVQFAKWFVDDCGGYYGESHWLWIASGCVEEGMLWIDRNDDYVSRFSVSLGFDSPTHWRPLPAPPQDREVR